MRDKLLRLRIWKAGAIAAKKEVFAAVTDNPGRTFTCYQNMLPDMSPRMLSRALTQLLKEGMIAEGGNEKKEMIFLQKAGAIKLTMRRSSEAC